jgi:hypothetical protein
MAHPQLPSPDELATLVKARAGQEPAARLHVAIEIDRELSEAGDAVIERFVAEARAAELSWTQIGELFGTSKQAAQKRYGAAQPGGWPGRWAPAAQHALNSAGDQARELGHNYLGTEHALLGLLAAREGLAAHVLADLGVTREAILAQLPGPCEPRPYECLGVAPRVKRALEAARGIADALGHRVANTEHLLAGIVTVPDALATEILAGLGAGPDEVRTALAGRLGVDRELLVVQRRRRRRHLRRAAA